MNYPSTPSKKQSAIENKVSEQGMNTVCWEKESMSSIMGNLCTSLLELYRVVNKRVDKEDPVDTIHVDFQKDFYHVPC